MSEISEPDRRQMDAITAGLPDNKSEKIRHLAAAGYKRADIARYLGIRYQFVYNVLSASRVRAGQRPQQPVRRAAGVTPAADDETSPEPPSSKWLWTVLGKGGRIELPRAFLEAMGAEEGDQVQLALDGNVVRVLSRTTALRELQAEVKRYVPEGVSLVDELLNERRAEAAREMRDSTDD